MRNKERQRKAKRERQILKIENRLTKRKQEAEKHRKKIEKK